MRYMLLLYGAEPSPDEPIDMEMIERAVEQALTLVADCSSGVEIRPVMDLGEM